jgi:hypothetical protein
MNSGHFSKDLRSPGARRKSSRFALPEKSGETVNATVPGNGAEAGRKRATSRTACTTGNDLAIEEEAHVRVPSLG